MNGTVKAGIVVLAIGGLLAIASYAYIESIPADRLVNDMLRGNKPDDLILARNLLNYVSPGIAAVGLLLLIAGVLMSSEGSQPETKKCPSCAEEIKVDAVKCHFCGAEFDPQVVTALVAERSAMRDEGIRKISVEAARTSKWSFALGLFALLFPLAGLFAIIVGCVALARLRSSDNRRAKTFAILGAALGLAGLFLPPVIQTQFLELIQRLNP